MVSNVGSTPSGGIPPPTNPSTETWESIKVSKAPVDPTLAQRIADLFRFLIRPFVSLISGLSNLYHTGKFLTINAVLPRDKCSYISTDEFALNEGHQQDIEKQFGKREKGNYITFVHLGTKPGWVDHSAMLAIITQVGEDGKPRHSAILFDAQGHAPGKLPLNSKSLESNGKENLRNVEDVYKYLMVKVPEENRPTLIYSTRNIQADDVSCTAYTGKFMEQLFDSVKESENFDSEKYMRDVVDIKVVTYWKARKLVKAVGDARRGGVGNASTSKNRLETMPSLSEFEVES